MEATASTRSPSMWNSSSQYSALATRKLRTSRAAEVEDQRAPVRVLAQVRVGVLVQRLAVEPGQRPFVLGEVRRHPVQEHADAGLVQFVHQVPEFVRVPEARGRARSRR